MLKIGHKITVPETMRGPKPDTKPEIIQVPEELETVPGHDQDQDTVNFYTRNYPIESHAVENFVYRKWSREVSDIKETRDQHETLNKPIVKASAESGNLEPTVAPVPGKDVTQEIKAKALELGFAMVGMTAYDSRYTYKSKRKWVKPFPHAICLAMEQPFEETQTIPSEPAEAAVFATYRREGQAGLDLADHIRSLGYYAQVHSPNDPASAVIPMFVEAGLGQQGAMGYLLSPHFGSRHRLMMITTDALVTHDKPVDIRYQRLLHHLPGVRKPLSWPSPHEGKGVVARRGKVQDNSEAMPTSHGAVRRLRRMHEGVSHPEVRDADGHGPLRRHRPGARQGYPLPGGLRDARPGILRTQRTAQVRRRLLPRPRGLW